MLQRYFTSEELAPYTNLSNAKLYRKGHSDKHTFYNNYRQGVISASAFPVDDVVATGFILGTECDGILVVSLDEEVSPALLLAEFDYSLR